MRKITLKIGGMSCAACSSSLEKALNRLDGVKAEVNIATEKAKINYDDKKIGMADIEKAVHRVGFTVVKDIDESISKKTQIKNQKTKLIVALIFTIPLLYIAMAPMISFITLPYPKFLSLQTNPRNFALVQLILTIPVMVCGYKFYTKGFSNLVRLNPNMDTLVAIGTSAAFVYSLYKVVLIFMGDIHAAHSLYFESTAVIITLILSGKYLEMKNRGKTNDAIKKLMNLSPKTATVIRDGAEKVIATDDIIVGDEIIVKPGESFAVDGVVIAGNTSVDEGMLTGESMPVDKNIGDKVFAATVNRHGSIHYEAKKVGKDTTLSQIIKLVEESQGSKAPIAKLADRISGIFVPIVIAIAFVSSLIWILVGKDIEFALSIFISVLVIACPCALGLATPTAIIVGTGKGASYGILFKDAASLEQLGKVNTVVFDKTGTVTVGKPELTDIRILNATYSEEEILRFAASAEKLSEHPLGMAVTEYAQKKNIKIADVENFISKTGFGIECILDNKKIRIGKKDFVNTNINTDDLENSGKTPLFIEIDGVVFAVIAVADTVKKSSRGAIELIHSMKIETVMLTGDKLKTANTIAEAAGINNVIAEVLPSEKAEKIKNIADIGKIVAMVGDGINDAPALAAANVGIAMGGGTDIAIESADVVLVNNNLESVAHAIELSRKTMRNIKQNLFWAFFYNTVGIPIACGLLYIFGGPLMNPMLSAAAMSLSSVSVVGNALRLNTFSIERK